MLSGMPTQRSVFGHQLIDSLDVLAGIGCLALIFVRLGWRLFMARLYLRGFYMRTAAARD